MSPVPFMSPDHIAAMNALLKDAPAVRAECARLPRPRVVSYALTDGPDGRVVHWTMTFADTVQFSLEKASAPDVRFVGDWARMIRATNAGRDGTQVDPGVSMDGDEAVLVEIETAFETARGVATVPVEFPSV